ncbi:MFS transporter [Streptosporangium pseudovulgare]|uniref:MFS transporter n=1 Tax=Streptosporangium pseudovulgare TaxID=35765 RepID=A0ABQ2R4Y4_9ACTN|nr:MFS transporter [Streptosporangium pseudovulgare]GGQ14021.1 MFS transporter [Streptosporangium pseudovulgare]
MTHTAVKPYTRRWAALAVLSASLLLVVMDMTILNVALPEMSADLKPGAVELLWMVDIYSLVVAGLLVTVSALGDRWGRKRMLVSGFAVFGLASVAVLWADRPAEVIAVRALLGIGGAMIMPSTLSMIRSLFTDGRERATALGIWAAMAAVGGALGPITGGLLLEAFSWHAAFLVNVPVMAIAIVAGLFLLPESRNPTPGRWDALGTVLSVVGMVAFVYAIKHLATEGPSAPTIGAAALAAITLVWFVRRCLRRRDPLLEVRLFRSGAFTSGTLAALTTSIAMAGMMLLMVQWMQLVQGYSPLQTGLAMLPMAAGSAVLSPLAPAMAARIGARTVLAGGLAISALGFLVLWIAPTTYPWVAASVLLIGAGMGSLAIASAVIMSGAPEEKAGSAAAIEETSYEVGGTLGVAVLGSLAAVLYRAGLPESAAPAVRESLGGALAVARELGSSDLAVQATRAFTESLEVTGLYGGVLMLVAAVAVWWLTPARLDLASAHH